MTHGDDISVLCILAVVVDWRQMFQTMCKGCDFPIEPGDHWVEAMGNNFHSECFNCSVSTTGALIIIVCTKSGAHNDKRHCLDC